MAALAVALAIPCTPLAAKVQATRTITINASIQKSCNLFVIPVMFGNVPRVRPAVNAQSLIRVSCTPDTAFTVALDNGRYFGGGSRRMQKDGTGGGANKWFPYEIYKDAARTQRWGSTGAEIVSRTSPSDGAPVNLTTYARATGNVIAGPYSDTVTVTLTF